MRPFILSPDDSQRVDPPVHDLLRQIPERSIGLHDADVALVPVTRLPDFKFNSALHDLKKPWVLIDYCEFGWDDPMGSSYLWGNDRIQRRDFQGEEWRKLDDFILGDPPVCIFQRELLERDRTDRILPIEYASWLPEKGMASPEEFKRRPLELMSSWGRSHESRMFLHGAIFSNAGRFGYDVVSGFEHIERAISDNSSSLKWATIHAPHYARIDVREVQKFNQMAKVVPCLPGCGFKTFRHGEACPDAIMAILKNKLAWTYPWDESNSIVLPPPIEDESDAGSSVKSIADTLMRPDLYDLYCRAMENARNYRYEFYLRQICKKIESCL